MLAHLFSRKREAAAHGTGIAQVGEENLIPACMNLVM